ncbi:MAG: lysylphosphatidylglycerol synthase transmembrane domain-containing protein [Bryocella sp.]
MKGIAYGLEFNIFLLRVPPGRGPLVTREKRLSLLKTLPGLAVSAFFIWWTFIRKNSSGNRGFDPEAFRGLHIHEPIWLIGVVLFGVVGYTTRCYRAWSMLRNVGAKFSVCSRVFMTSLAANNILPLRIGDVMRVFTYAADQNATPSMVLSTVILEKLLDVFSLAVLFVITMHFGQPVSSHVRVVAEVGVAISTVGLLVIVFGARTLEGPLRRLFAKTHNAKINKIEHWILLAIDCVRQIGVVGTLMLLV